MTLNEYQKQAMTTELMSRKEALDANDPAFIAKVLGLVGESGEFAEKVKKLVRDKAGVVNEEDKVELMKEIGDVLWYVSALSDYLGYELETVAEKNLEKLFDRRKRGVSTGSGDNR